MDAGMISSSNECCGAAALFFVCCEGNTINLNKKLKLIYYNLDTLAHKSTLEESLASESWSLEIRLK